MKRLRARTDTVPPGNGRADAPARGWRTSFKEEQKRQELNERSAFLNSLIDEPKPQLDADVHGSGEDPAQWRAPAEY